MRLEKAPGRLLPLLVMLAGAGFILARAVVHQHVTFTPDSFTYIQFEFPRDLLDGMRTFIYPLFLKAVARVSPDYGLVPAAHALLYAAAVFVFWHGLRRAGFSPWAACITAAPLFFSETVTIFGDSVLTDAPALALAVATFGAMLLAAARPRRAGGWVALAVLIFAAHMTRPAYLFLIGWVPVVGVLVAWLIRSAPGRLWVVAAAFAASSAGPFVLFGALRGVAVGHFGSVSAGGANAIGIAAEMLDAEVCKSLPHHLRPTALRALQERDAADLPRAITRRGADLSQPDAWYVHNVIHIGLPLAAKFCGTNKMLAVNQRLSALSGAVFRLRAGDYASWIARVFAFDLAKLARQWGLAVAGLVVLFAGACGWMAVRRRGEAGTLTARFDFRELAIITLAGLGFYAASLLLVAIVEFPVSRYTQAARVFIPSILAMGFFSVARGFRPSAEPAATEAAGAFSLGANKLARGLVVIGLAAGCGLLGWLLLAGRPEPAGVSALHVAAMDGPAATMTGLLRGGADINAADRDGLTPLHWAAVAGREETAKLLLASGANPAAASQSGIRPIHLASTPAVVNELVARGARLDAADHDGFGPLHWALAPDVLSAMVKAGADPNAIYRDRAGAPAMPALHLAITRNNVVRAKHLLALGANPNLRDGNGHPALFGAVEACPSLLGALLERGADRAATVRLKSLPAPSLRMFRIEDMPDDELTALHWAAIYRHVEAVKELLAAGFDVNARTPLGMTPLHWAAAAGRTRVASLLLENGADVAVKDHAGLTPAELAVKRGRAEVARLLSRKRRQ
ncbi:MAG: ankyrin repeat domain-containing protein [Verrucomicrobia bacterium]|nr:ankyrin repeat domain-containing protein [Verrucomicrobiota bacterium]